MSDKLIVALDVPDMAEAEKLVRTLLPAVKIFKVGKELFTSCGPAVVEMIHARGAKVFLDLKFHDIPNTVAGACVAATRLKVFMLNVHASGGKNMMTTAQKAVKDEALRLKIHPPILLGVTVLTSLADDDLKEIGLARSVSQEVEILARLADNAGLDGVVASPKEIALVRKATKKGFLIVTPGVRPAWAAADDQKRVMTPREAISAGADYLVAGRPITQDPDPLEAAKKILKEIV